MEKEYSHIVSGEACKASKCNRRIGGYCAACNKTFESPAQKEERELKTKTNAIQK